MSHHLCLGEWNSWVCSRQYRNNLHIYSTYLQTYTEDNVQNTHTYTPYTQCTIFCNIFNVFTVTFDQFNVSLLYKSIVFPSKIKLYWQQIFEQLYKWLIWTSFVYIYYHSKVMPSDIIAVQWYWRCTFYKKYLLVFSCKTPFEFEQNLNSCRNKMRRNK